MKLLLALLQEAKKSEMDPSQVTASDVSAYVRQVKSALKGQKMTKGSIGSAVRDIAEDDPKFGAHPGALSKLAAAVAAKLLVVPVKEGLDDEDFSAPAATEPPAPKQPDAATIAALSLQFTAGEISFDEFKAQLASLEAGPEATTDAPHGEHPTGGMDDDLDGMDDDEFDSHRYNESADADDEDDSIPAKFSASSTKAELSKQASYLKAEIAKASDRMLAAKLKQALTKIQGFQKSQVSESLSPRAEKALSNKLSKVSESADSASKEVVEESSHIDVDELTTTEISSKLLAAAKAGHPGVEGMKVHADATMMRVEVPGTDRCYATLNLDTGALTVLKEGWDSEEEEEACDGKEMAAAKKPKTKLSPRATVAMTKKLAKAPKKVAETVEVKPEVAVVEEKVAEVKVVEAAAPKTLGRFAQSIVDAKSAE
jgi:hypothetical protein